MTSPHGIQDDYYLNLVDWSSTNVLGVGLGACVYLWSAHTSAVTKLCDLGENNGTDSITSINWVEKVCSACSLTASTMELTLIAPAGITTRDRDQGGQRADLGVRPLPLPPLHVTDPF